MADMGIVQARTPEEIKEKANAILDQLGLNMSTYINMALNQLILKRGIPFSVELPPVPASVNADLMTADEIHEKILKGYFEAESGQVRDAEEIFKEFLEKHESNNK